MTELITLSSAVDKLNDFAKAGNILWITSLCVSKIAIIAMLLRTTQTRLHRRFQYGVGALIVAQCLASILLLTVDCSFHRELAWEIKFAAECPQMEPRWIALTTLDIVTEILLLFLPIQLVWGLQMGIRTKFIVISAFWLRLPYVLVATSSWVLTDHTIEPSSFLLFANTRYTNLQPHQTSRSRLLQCSSGRLSNYHTLWPPRRSLH
jgi:hypothetical protein